MAIVFAGGGGSSGGDSPKPIIYAATSGGLSVPADGGAHFSNLTTANGLGDNYVWDVYVQQRSKIKGSKERMKMKK